MATDSPLQSARTALENASRLTDDVYEQGRPSHVQAASLGFSEAIAWALLDLAVSYRVMAGREVR
jgi:hypothetical protein